MEGAALMIFSAPSKEMEREKGSWKQGIVYLSLFWRTARETAETKRRSEGENKRILTERRHLLYPLTFLPLRHPVIFLPPGKESALIESAVLHPHPPPLISSLCTPIFHSSSSSPPPPPLPVVETSSTSDNRGEDRVFPPYLFEENDKFHSPSPLLLHSAFCLF